MKQKFRLFIFFIPLLIYACAKQVPLTGGPKDVAPPELVSATPALNSTNFKSKTIKLKFNEYVKLNNVSQNLIISPPLDENPTVKLKGKTIEVKIDTSKLKKDVTYTLTFPDVIGDENENNLISSFVYAFTMGEIFDSLSIAGTLIDVLTQKPEADVTVLLHSDFSDSIFYKNMPDYVARTDKNGKFLIPNIAEKPYHIFALKDINKNFKFDLPTEKIAFLDTIIIPSVEIDTAIFVDTTMISDTTNSLDSLKSIQKTYKFKPDNIKLILFDNNKQKQYIKSYKRLNDNYLELIFNSTQYENYSLKVVNDNDAFFVAKENPDTIFIWLNNIPENKDSLRIVMNYTCPVTLGNIDDTLKFMKAAKEFKDTAEVLKIVSDVKILNKFKIAAKYPVESFDVLKTALQIKEDSIFKSIDFQLVKDSSDVRNLIIEANFIDTNKYIFIVDSAAIKDIYGLTNLKIDTIEIKPTPLSELSELKISFSKSGNYIVELLLNDKIIYSQYTDNQAVVFEHIKPASYQIKIIEDKNGNKRWDSGDYSKLLQPEPIDFYPENYEVKANFQHEIIY